MWEDIDIDPEENPEEAFRDFLERYLPRWSIITQDPVNETAVFQEYDDPDIEQKFSASLVESVEPV